jgi:hypothetical protein
LRISWWASSHAAHLALANATSEGLGPSAPIPFLFNDIEVTAVDWVDTFNGTAGGIGVLSNLGPIDPGSGSGGITLVYAPTPTRLPVPEPSTLAVLSVGLILISIIWRRRRV